MWLLAICEPHNMGGANLYSIYSKCSNAMSWLGIALFTRVNSFVEALINMVCELKLCQGLTKNCVKIPW